MKLAIILSSAPGYSETFFKSKIKGLQSHGHEVVLVTAKKDVQFDLCEQLTHPKIHKNKVLRLVEILKVFLSLSIYYKSVLAFYKLERKEQTPVKRIFEKIYFNATLLKLKVDWLHFGFATMTKDRELVAKAIDAKMGVSFRGFDINVYPLKHPNCYDRLWDYVDAVHSISIDLWNKACDLGLPITKPYQIIPPAIDSRIIRDEVEDKEDNISLEILTIARIHYIKGIDILIETSKILKDNGLDFIWRVIGTGDPQSIKRYKYHINSSGLEDVVVLEGEKTHDTSLKLLEQTNLYVQTSYTEGFCNALLEAQAKGKICIAFNSGGISENVIHCSTGFLVDQVSGNALAMQILETMALSQQDKMNITQRAIKRVKTNFTLDQQQKEFIEFYTK